MAIHGYIWLLISNPELPHFSVKQNEIWVRDYMAVYGYTWLYTAIHGYPWLSMAIHGCTWLSMAIHGYK